MECMRQEGDKIKTRWKEKERAEYFPSVLLLSGSGRARDSVEEEMEKKDERGHEQRE